LREDKEGSKPVSRDSLLRRVERDFFVNLKEKLGHQFVITAELDPPRGSNPDATLAEARVVRHLVDAVNIYE
jgi:hypothetical protein